MEDLSNLKAVLTKHQDKEGVSLYTHLQFLMNQMKNNPLKAIDDSYKDFETISSYARKQIFNYKSPLTMG